MPAPWSTAARWRRRDRPAGGDRGGCRHRRSARIDAGSFIGRDAGGQDTHFHARVTLHHACEIGARGIVHSGAVIGTDGFGLPTRPAVDQDPASRPRHDR
jgi:hypothetical protein